jgi:hypothetical protein
MHGGHHRDDRINPVRRIDGDQIAAINTPRRQEPGKDGRALVELAV